jgi:hypothetical protein
MLVRMWGKWSLIHSLQECKLVQHQYGGSSKLKIVLPCDPALQLLDIYPKGCKSVYTRDTCTPMLIAALFIIAR